MDRGPTLSDWFSAADPTVFSFTTQARKCLFAANMSQWEETLTDVQGHSSHDGASERKSGWREERQEDGNLLKHEQEEQKEEQR